MHYRQIHLRSPVGPCPVAKRIGKIERQRIFGSAEFLIFEFIGQRYATVQDSGVKTRVGNCVSLFWRRGSRFTRLFLRLGEITSPSRSHEEATCSKCRHEGGMTRHKLPRFHNEGFVWLPRIDNSHIEVATSYRRRPPTASVLTARKDMTVIFRLAFEVEFSFSERVYWQCRPPPWWVSCEILLGPDIGLWSHALCVRPALSAASLRLAKVMLSPFRTRTIARRRLRT
jgi:hypothetical protein